MKTRWGGYDGGQARVKATAAFGEMGSVPVVAEAALELELSVLVARAPSGEVSSIRRR